MWLTLVRLVAPFGGWIAAAAAAVIGLFAVRRAGHAQGTADASAKTAARTAEAREAQLDAALNRPSTRADLAQRMRDPEHPF